MFNVPLFNQILFNQGSLGSVGTIIRGFIEMIKRTGGYLKGNSRPGKLEGAKAPGGYLSAQGRDSH